MRKLMSVVMLAFVFTLGGAMVVAAPAYAGQVCLDSSGMRINCH